MRGQVSGSVRQMQVVRARAWWVVALACGGAALTVLAIGCGGSGSSTTPTAEVVDQPTPMSTITPLPAPTTEPVPTATQQTDEAVTPTETPVPIRSLGVSSGSLAPDFEIELLNGGTLRLSELQGKVVVLNFWASWCPPCRAEMPAFQSISQEYEDQGVVFVGVAVSDTEEAAGAFMTQAGVTYPLGLDTTGEISKEYMVVSMPTTYFINREGEVARKLSGAANQGALRIFLNGQLAAQ